MHSLKSMPTLSYVDELIGHLNARIGTFSCYIRQFEFPGNNLSDN